MSKIRLLMVDDDREVLSGMVRFFKMKKSEFDVSSTTSSEEAVGWIRSGSSYDAIVSDMQMPVLNGMKFYLAVQEIAPGLAEKFIFVSGGAGNAETHKFLSGYKRKIMKPASMSDLTELIKKVAAEPSK